MSNELLMYSRHVDELINEVMKNPTEENKSNLRDAQQELDRKVLGRKLKQWEIDEQIRRMGE